LLLIENVSDDIFVVTPADFRRGYEVCDGFIMGKDRNFTLALSIDISRFDLLATLRVDSSIFS
jgi:hypothetical protein